MGHKMRGDGTRRREGFGARTGSLQVPQHLCCQQWCGSAGPTQKAGRYWLPRHQANENLYCGIHDERPLLMRDYPEQQILLQAWQRSGGTRIEKIVISSICCQLLGCLQSLKRQLRECMDRCMYGYDCANTTQPTVRDSHNQNQMLTSSHKIPFVSRVAETLEECGGEVEGGGMALA